MPDNKQSFEIGQIVYVLSEKAEAVVPAIIVEEMVVKKLNGSSVSWKVAIGPPNKKKIVETDDLSGDVYTSLEEIKQVMTKRLEGWVENLIKQARTRTEVWYGKKIENNNQITSTPNGKIDPASFIDNIEGGENYSNNELKKENVKITAPINNGPLLHNQDQIDPSDPKSVLRAKLKSMALPEPDENIDDGYEGEFIETEDGRRVPIKYNINQ